MRFLSFLPSVLLGVLLLIALPLKAQENFNLGDVMVRAWNYYNPDDGHVWEPRMQISQPWDNRDNIPDTGVVMRVTDPITGEVDKDRSGFYWVNGNSMFNDLDGSVCQPCGTDMYIWTQDLKDINENPIEGGDGYNEMYITWTEPNGTRRSAVHAYTSGHTNVEFESFSFEESNYPPAPDMSDLELSLYTLVIDHPSYGGYFNDGDNRRVRVNVSGVGPWGVGSSEKLCLDVWTDGDSYNVPQPLQEIYCGTFEEWGLGSSGNGIGEVNIGWCELYVKHNAPPGTAEPVWGGAWNMRARVDTNSVSGTHAIRVYSCN